MTEDFLAKPESVYAAAIHAGLFGNDNFLYDLEGFIDRACGAWNTQINNYYSCPTEAHEEAAKALHELYVMYRECFSVIPRTQASRFYKMFVALSKGNLDDAFREFGNAKWPLVRKMAEQRNNLNSFNL